MLILILKIIFQHVYRGGYRLVVKLLTVSRFRLTVTLKLWILERPCFIQSFWAAKHSILANKIYEYNLLTIKQLVYVMENYL